MFRQPAGQVTEQAIESLQVYLCLIYIHASCHDLIQLVEERTRVKQMILDHTAKRLFRIISEFASRSSTQFWRHRSLRCRRYGLDDLLVDCVAQHYPPQRRETHIPQ